MTKLETIIKKEIKDVKKHFKKDGWDLSLEFIISDILYQYFDTDIENYIRRKFVKSIKGIKCKIEDNGNLSLVKDDCIPVSYDVVKNKILINKFKDTLDGNFIFLGTL